MFVLMMFIMRVFVIVLQYFVSVFVAVMFG